MTYTPTDRLTNAIEQMDSLDQIEFLMVLEELRDGETNEDTWDVNGNWEDLNVTFDMLPTGIELIEFIASLENGYGQ
jgi:hypothetical protein